MEVKTTGRAGREIFVQRQDDGKPARITAADDARRERFRPAVHVHDRRCRSSVANNSRHRAVRARAFHRPRTAPANRLPDVERVALRGRDDAADSRTRRVRDSLARGGEHRDAQARSAKCQPRCRARPLALPPSMFKLSMTTTTCSSTRPIDSNQCSTRSQLSTKSRPAAGRPLDARPIERQAR